MENPGSTPSTGIPIGRLERVFTAPVGGGAMEARTAVRAVPGKGLEGDRYARGTGTWSRPGLWSEVTLVRAEDVEELAAELDRELEPSVVRRNLVVRGVEELALLADASFRVGEVVLEGVRPCGPCAHLERVTGIPGLRRALAGRGGLRARFVSEGVLRPGDPILRAT